MPVSVSPRRTTCTAGADEDDATRAVGAADDDDGSGTPTSPADDDRTPGTRRVCPGWISDEVRSLARRRASIAAP